jgi:putative ABC transport system permease protein
MLCFAFGLPDSLNNYGEKAPDMMFAKYQYILMSSRDDDETVIGTSEDTAEPFDVVTLMYPKNKEALFEGRGSGGDESVTVYGIVKESDYISLSDTLGENGVYLSTAFRDKFRISMGDFITLYEEYENKSYQFRVEGFIDYDGGIAAFVRDDNFKLIFEKDNDEFSGFFSQNEITDIEEQYIATVITEEDVRKVTVQLMHSMGGFMNVFKYALVVLAATMIYLLAKIIIERNEHAISMTKILGFTNGEIGALYVTPTAIVVVLCAVTGFGVGYYLMVWIFRIFMLQMDGYFAFYMKPVSMLLSVLYLLTGYAAVSVVDYIRIKRISMSVALKDME